MATSKVLSSADEGYVTTSSESGSGPESAGTPHQSRQYTIRALRNKPSVKLDGLIASTSLKVCQRSAMFFLGAPCLHKG